MGAQGSNRKPRVDLQVRKEGQGSWGYDIYHIYDISEESQILFFVPKSAVAGGWHVTALTRN